MFDPLAQFSQAFHDGISGSDSFTAALDRFGRKFGLEFRPFQDRFFIHHGANRLFVPLAAFKSGRFQSRRRFFASFRFEGGKFRLTDVSTFASSPRGSFKSFFAELFSPSANFGRTA
ncbi:MAG: hypothetical protein IT432_12210 [Phycisphaerales bacterium]|nr:hypothetical protein [Phycisphaerales bacterium]